MEEGRKPITPRLPPALLVVALVAVLARDGHSADWAQWLLLLLQLKK
ncbi:hypothetical protein EDD99_1854 [Streptomyces sp. 846.5]|nr:hypothetical protein EDD99_1854 [Streptomyces sp. 846.5]